LALASVLFFRGERVLLLHELLGVDEQPVHDPSRVVRPEDALEVLLRSGFQVREERTSGEICGAAGSGPGQGSGG